MKTFLAQLLLLLALTVVAGVFLAYGAYAALRDLVRWRQRRRA